MSTQETVLAEKETVLSAQGLVMKFGGITATNNVTLNLKKGARHALIGDVRGRGLLRAVDCTG